MGTFSEHQQTLKIQARFPKVSDDVTS
jgi:hypothetical protein